MRILLSSVGRRGYLVRFFKEALDPGDEIWGGDYSPYASAFHNCDHSVILPEVTDPNYVPEIINLCRKLKINMIIPLIDPELEVLSLQRELFVQDGILTVVSPYRSVETCYDKFLTYQFCLKNSIAAPLTTVDIQEAKQLISRGRLTWPLVVKPRKGSASANITVCCDMIQLDAAFESCPQPIIQQYIDGAEYGYDIFNDIDFRPLGVFCKRKIAMRAGETDKAVSTDDPQLIAFGLKIAQSLEIFGPMDVDVMVGSDGPQLLEVNPRFGGGYPCAHSCGADFPGKLIKIARGEKLTPNIGSYPSGIYMFKQDEILNCNQQKIDSFKDYRLL